MENEWRNSMSERAYSYELNEEISAVDAQRKSIKGELENAKAFRCQDDSCKIDLTCCNWKVRGAKRIYYTPSCRNCLHSVTCLAVSFNEEKRQTEIETEDGKRTIRKSGIISMQKATGNARKAEETDIGENESVTKNVRRRNNVKTDRNGIENRNISSIKTYVNFFYDEEIDNEAEIFKVGGELMSLNTLFINADEEIEEEKVRIFYGKAMLITPEFNKDLILLRFSNGQKPDIYTNRSQLLKRISSRIIYRYLDKENEAELFFRGYIKNGKFESFNGKFYCDLHIM